MNLRTNPFPEMHYPLPPLGSRALSTLQGGGLVLLPTSNLWQLTAHALKPGAINRLLTTCPPAAAGRPELIFADREMLWQWCPRIPPRLDTLLEYHKRPLTVIIPAGRQVPLSLVDQNGEVAVRLAGDSFCYRLCEDVEAPLVSCLAMGKGATDLPTGFGKVRSDILRAANYTVPRRQRDTLAAQPTVTARLKSDGELEFLR